MNVDGLATKSFHQERRREYLNELVGKKAGKRLDVLSSPLRFVVNLHGLHGDSNSWVLKKPDLMKLIRDRMYRRFIENIFSSFRVLFIGVTVDDIAIGGFLNELKSQGVNLCSHFWVTERRDIATERWAQRNGINIIRYKAIKNDHTELKEFLKAVTQYVPKETMAPPVVPAKMKAFAQLPSPQEIAVKNPETIRNVLNSYAAEILKQMTIESFEEYEAFRKKYGRAIHNADYAEPDTPDNLIFGYKLTKKIGGGGFSTVYRATKEGEEYAVKKLRSERVGVKGILQCFRRGVKSMEILTKESVDGVVPYKEAYEIPPCVIMDLINGPDLRDVVLSGQLSFRDKLKIALDVAKIIRAGHNLQQRVLHRDIRPGNIMLMDYDQKHENFKVVVLDFDLSWHREAIGQSIRPEDIESRCYHAPEQIMHIPNVSTRNALIDSFGFGMTMFFLFSGKDPLYSRYVKENYMKYLRDELKLIECGEWDSFSLRIARLIHDSTKYRQNERLDMGQIPAELQRLFRVCNKAAKCDYVDLFAEELLYRCLGPTGYNWDNNQLMGRTTLVSGFDIKLTAYEVKRIANLRICWVAKGRKPRKKITKFFVKKKETLKETFRKGGWQKVGFEWSREKLDMEYNVSLARLKSEFEDTVKALRKCIDILRFE